MYEQHIQKLWRLLLLQLQFTEGVEPVPKVFRSNSLRKKAFFMQHRSKAKVLRIKVCRANTLLPEGINNSFPI
jgi:hypothetical protein